MRELILVFDAPVEEIPPAVVAAAREPSRGVPVRLLGYNPRQHWVAARINWGWVYSWMSWCLAIGQARTRAVLVHDLDALPLDASVFETIYDNWLEAGAHFCGIRVYSGNGVTPEMGLVTTYELALDVRYVRGRFRPFDLFNKLALVDGRVVDFDTMLHAQWLSPGRAVRPIEEVKLVHPSQLICHYTDLVSGRSDLGDRLHMLPILPYFFYLGGDGAAMESALPGLEEPDASTIDIFRHVACIGHLPPEQWAWLEKQIRRVEQALYGSTRPDVARYLEGFIRRAGSKRTVGRESGPTAVADI